MFSQKKWCVLFAVLFLGLAAEVFAPQMFVRTADAREYMDVREYAKAQGPLTICDDVFAPVDRISTEDIWMDVYQELMTNDLVLMSSSTYHIAKYHNRNFVVTNDDYQVLLQIVEAEAGTEDIMGRMLVANVILNRLELGFGGNTISDVVFAKGQFSPVADGRFFTVTPTETTIEAVNRVLDGEDYSEGALYFMNRTRASKRGARWFDRNLKLLFQHGDHGFYGEK